MDPIRHKPVDQTSTANRQDTGNLGAQLQTELQTFLGTRQERREEDLGGIKVQVPMGVNVMLDTYYDTAKTSQASAAVRLRMRVVGNADQAGLFDVKPRDHDKKPAHAGPRIEFIPGSATRRPQHEVGPELSAAVNVLHVKAEPGSLVEITLSGKGKPDKVVTARVDQFGMLSVDATGHNHASVRVASSSTSAGVERAPVWSPARSMPVPE